MLKKPTISVHKPVLFIPKIVYMLDNNLGMTWILF